MPRLSVPAYSISVILVGAMLPWPHSAISHPPWFAPTASVAGQQPDAVSDLLAKSAAYLESYDRQLSAVISDEQYEQHRPVGVRVDPVVLLHSDIMLLDLGGSSWVEFRDVFEANRRPVRNHAARLQALFEHPPSDLLAQAQRIADESAHYNIGVPRNINVPTMTLSYLTRANQPRSAFTVSGQDTIGKTGVTVLRFRETTTPPLIKVPAGHLETSGRFWIASETGAVWRSELSVDLPEGPEVSKAKSLKGTITVNYDVNPDLKFLVPVSMEEYYDAPENLRGKATYSHYQAFSVNVSTLRRGGGN
jgi:hypothetical protein